MPVRVLYVMDDFKNVDPRGDTTLALIWESQKRGQENYICGIHQLGLEGDTGFALCQPIHFNQPPQTKLDFEWVNVETLRSFDDFDFVWMRKDPPVNQAFFTATFILDRHNPKKTLMLNNPSAMRIANEKLWAHFASDLYPDGGQCKRQILLTAAQEMEKIVLKPIDAAGGYGVLCSITRTKTFVPPSKFSRSEANVRSFFRNTWMRSPKATNACSCSGERASAL